MAKRYSIKADDWASVVYRWVAERKIDCENGHRPCYRNCTYASEECRECVREHKEDM